MDITRDTTIGDILKKVPQSIEVFSRYNIDAACCKPTDTILELAAQDAGVDTDELVEQLNKVVASSSAKSGKPKITADMTMDEIVQKYPQVTDIIIEYGLHCVGCQVAAWETLGEGARVHGMSEEEVEDFIQDLNDAAKEE